MENTKMFNSDKIETVKEHMLQRRETIAVAESVTAGFLQAAIASADKATDFFQGGITTYNLGQKTRHLNIDPIHAQACNCVSESVAIEMAKAASRNFLSHWGIGVTGYASPVPESGNEVFAHFAIVYRDKLVCSQKLSAMSKKHMNVQLEYVEKIIEALLVQLAISE